MKFYFLDDKAPDRQRYAKIFSDACAREGVQFEHIHVNSFNPLHAPVLGKEDALYRHAVNKRAKSIERILLNAECAHFYEDWRWGLGKRASSYFYNKQANLPVIKTISLIPNIKTDLSEVVEYLGGFPLIVKVMGKSNGVGVIKVDSDIGLKTLFDFLRASDISCFIRSYVEHAYYGRLIVLGGKVIASHKAYAGDTDFRTNARDIIDQQKMPFTFSDEVNAVAVAAVQSLGLQFGGVDILFTTEDKYYISEVNFPCSFHWTADITGVDIAGEMLKYLLSQQG